MTYKIVYNILDYAQTFKSIICTYVHMQGINTAGGPNEDVVGHGTNVAGCAMSNTYGAAHRGTAIAVRIDRDHSRAPDTA